MHTRSCQASAATSRLSPVLRDTPPPGQTASAGKSESGSLRIDNIGPRKRGGARRGAEVLRHRSPGAARGRLLDLNTAPQCPSDGRLCVFRPAYPISCAYHHPSPSLPERRTQPSSAGTLPTSDQVTDDCSQGRRRRLSAQLTPPRTALVQGHLPTDGPWCHAQSDPQNTPGSLSGSQTCVYHQPRSLSRGFPGGSVVKNLPANAGDQGSIPGSGRSPGEGNAGNPLQYSCLEKPRDNGAWRTTPHGVAKSRTQLSNSAAQSPVSGVDTDSSAQICTCCGQRTGPLPGLGPSPLCSSV